MPWCKCCWLTSQQSRWCQSRAPGVWARLAKKIFNDRAIQVEFKSKVWLSITESYNTEKLLSSAITQAGEGREVHGDREVLTQALTKTLSSGKFLMVLDDVWSAGLWTDVLESPVIIACRNQPGSRVIITTRDEDLVKKNGDHILPAAPCQTVV